MILKYQKLFVIVLLGVVFFVPFFSAQNFSPSSDEVSHLPSGYSYWKTGQINLNPQHPPFVKLATSFPLLFMDLDFNSQDPNLAGPFRNEWSFGENFLFSNDTDRLLMWGRLSVMLFSVLLGFYIYKWASEMFGSTAGFASLFLYAFMPNIMAHSQFVTTDVALASFSFITFYYLWKFSKLKLKKYLVFSGLFLGLALSSKFSATIFLPVIVFFIFVCVWRFKNEINITIRRFVGTGLMIAIPAFLVLYLTYFMPTDSGFYIKGLQTVYADWKPGYEFYLNGAFSQNGWWYYFLEAFLIKTPIPFLMAFTASLLFYGKLNISKLDKAFIFLPMLFFALITSMKAQNVSVRYLIPSIPFMILYTGGGLSKIFQSFNFLKFENVKTSIKVVSILILVLAGWYVFSAMKIYPDYMAYFNEFVGGAKNGYKYLDDSNVEWGQDLKRMKDYQTKNPDIKVVSSWNRLKPEYYGIENVIPLNDTKWWQKPEGLYAVNTTLLIRMQRLSETRNDPTLNWLALYKPIDRMGYAFYIFKF